MNSQPRLLTPSGHKRARAVGVPFDGTPGPLNSITDVAGIEVGYSTIIRGEGPLVPGKGPVRTGVTAVLPRGRPEASIPVFAGLFSLNGAGELTGAFGIDEWGAFDGPVTITNTHSVGVARDATVKWMLSHAGAAARRWYLPVAAETYDGHLNDTNGFHVHEQHVYEAIDSARAGPVEEGSVGGGTGMVCYEFKGGSGTASRTVTCGGRPFTLGVFVQSNFGIRSQLTVAGVRVGRKLQDGAWRKQDTGSVIALVATDAPLLPHQLKRIARRVSLGIARTGSTSGDGSGDIFLAFSTANADAAASALVAPESSGGGAPVASVLPSAHLEPLFAATVQATEEAVINSMVANEPMTGRDGHTVQALPHDRLTALLRDAGVLT
jgi:L-aminopeptidase/D-esterase-like protein